MFILYYNTREQYSISSTTGTQAQFSYNILLYVYLFSKTAILLDIQRYERVLRAFFIIIVLFINKFILL